MSKDYSKIAIHSVPRSGSSWLGQIFNSSPVVNFKFQPLFSYAFKSFLNEKSSNEMIDDFFEKIAMSNDEFLTQNDKVKSGKYPHFIKKECNFVVYKEVRYHNILTNMLEISSDLKLICLIRNPLAVLDDWLNTPREFRKDLGWDELEEWRFAQKKNAGRPEEFNGYEKWKEAVFIFEYLNMKYPDNVYLIEYKNLLKNSLGETEKMFHFCGIDIERQTVDFLNKSNEINDDDPYSVFKKVYDDNAWEKRLNEIIVKDVYEDLEKNNLTKYL